MAIGRFLSILLVAAAVLVCVNRAPVAYAIEASPFPILVTQPDGSKVTVCLASNGDVELEYTYLNICLLQ